MKIAIFYHIAQMGMGAFIYQSQLHRLYTSGLIKAANYIHFGVNGDQELFNVPEKAKVVRNKIHTEETETLMSLKDFAAENPDHKILYFHTKGASKGTLNSQSIRLMMEYFVIDRWKECVEHLNEYDCVGQHWVINGDTVWSDGSVTSNTENIGHYYGNFWWANSSYIQTLNNEYLETPYRFDREFWIGTGKNYKQKSLDKMTNKFRFDIDLNNDYYFREEEYMI
jgi:hypothetical protein